MAKDEKLGGLLTGRHTIQPGNITPVDNSDLETGHIRPSGVGLREGEIQALDAIAQHYEISRNSLIRLAARQLIIAWRAGELDLDSMIETPATPKKRLRY